MITPDMYQRVIDSMQKSTERVQEIRQVVLETKEDLEVMAKKHILLQKEHQELLTKHLELQQEMLAIKESNKAQFLN